jgi:hypothetical protein
VRHKIIELSGFERLVLKRLDGSRDRSQLLDELVIAVAQGEFPLIHNNQPITDSIAARAILERSLEPCLGRLGTSALLVG